MLLSVRYAKGYGTTSYFPLSAITDRLYARNQLIHFLKIYSTSLVVELGNAMLAVVAHDGGSRICQRATRRAEAA